MTIERPAVFVGSSVEGLAEAQTLQILLDHTCEVTLWSQGVFGLGEGSLEALVERLPIFDFAILCLTADDLVESRGRSLQAPRDNVLIELGLFIGALGRNRTFIVFDRASQIKMPSDLAGVTAATYGRHRSGNLQASMGAAAGRIQEAIVRLGPRPRGHTPLRIEEGDAVARSTLQEKRDQMVRALENYHINAEGIYYLGALLVEAHSFLVDVNAPEEEIENLEKAMSTWDDYDVGEHGRSIGNAGAATLRISRLVAYLKRLRV